MMRRPGGAEFAPGAHVFPGGSVHPEDSLLGDAGRGAAIRELFEEVGILLARGRDGAAGARLADRIRASLARGASFPAALAAARLQPSPEELIYFARWITPEQLKRRFDTRFYLARLPEGQAVHPQAGEVDHWLWVTPAAALADPTFSMVFVTRRILAMLAVEPEAEKLRSRYSGLRRIRVVRPTVMVENGTFRVVIDSLPRIPRAPGRPR